MSRSGDRSGVLPVDKPPGPTSHDVVARARRALGIRKVGHTGTLDPFASGLLLLCTGYATRIGEYLKDLPKEYEAEARLGVATETDDPEGAVVREDQGWRSLGVPAIEEALHAFHGPIVQRPPRYSAKKVAGEAAHRRVRRGEVVELPTSEVEVLAVELLGVELPAVRFRIRCSPGTYIRAVARDLGEALGVGGHLTHLRRTAVGSFRVDDALPADQLDVSAEVDRVWISALEALAHLPTLEVDEDQAVRLAHGREIISESSFATDRPIALAREGQLVAVGRSDGGIVRPVKVFSS